MADRIEQERLFAAPAVSLTLADRFLVPPFSVLDARAGYWKERKQLWANLGIASELGREATLLYSGEEVTHSSLNHYRELEAIKAMAKALDMTEEAAAERYRAQKSSQGGAPPPGRGAGLTYGAGMEEDTHYRRQRERREAEEEAVRSAGGLQSGEGREGKLAITGGRQAHDVGYYARLKEWQDAEEVRRRIAEESGREYVPSERPEPDPAGAFDSGAGRGESLLSGAAVRKGFGGDYDLAKGENAWGGAGTSIFDPVLCELAYRWFCPEGGLILDPFAGGSVRGIVAAMMERRYLGIDLRPEQVEANRAQGAELIGGRGLPHMPEWRTGDSLSELDELEPGSADFLFTCPPYYNLEQYSDDPLDLSNASTYTAFAITYTEIIRKAVRALAPDRFAVFVVGDVRDKKTGAYVGLVPDTIRAFEEAGASYYNEGILVTSVGSLPIRTSRLFGPGRKLGKTHQNVLGFVKGDWRKAAAACPMALEVAVEYGGATWKADGTVSVEEAEAFTGEEPGT